jgi:hypothetical protein
MRFHFENMGPITSTWEHTIRYVLVAEKHRPAEMRTRHGPRQQEAHKGIHVTVSVGSFLHL